MGHRVPWHRGKAEAKLNRGRGAPWSSGHGEANTTATLPAARKKSAHRELPAKTSHKDWLARRARS